MKFTKSRQVVTVGVVITLIVSVGTVGFTGIASAAGSTDVAVTPSTQTIDAGTTTTVNITVTNTDGGIGAYSFVLSTDDMGTASITDIELYGNPATAETNISADGSKVTVNAALADSADTGDVTIATVTIAGDSAGESSLSLSNVSIADELGESYSIASINHADLSVLESTAIQNTEINPDQVDENQTTSTTFKFDVIDVSNDGKTDTITVTAPSDITFTSPTATVTDGNGATIHFEDAPSLRDTNGGTNNQLAFSITPGNSINTSRIHVQVETEVSYPAVESNQSQSFNLYVDDSSGDTATDAATLTVLNTESADTGPTQSISVDPANQNISVSETATYDIVVSNVTNGIGAYSLSVSTDNASVATITDVELAGNPTDATTTIAYTDTGGAVTIETALLDTADTGEVPIVTLSIHGKEGGNATISPTIRSLGDESGNSYEVSSVTSGTLRVKAGPGDVTDNGDAATDPDGDGKYEDVNGDGSVNVLDVQALFWNLDSDKVSGNAALDLNDDGDTNILDVQTLFAQL